MKKFLLVALLAGCLIGLSQANVLADSLIINQVLYDQNGNPYTGTIKNDNANTLAVSFDLITSIGGLEGFCIEGGQSFNIPPPAVYNIVPLSESSNTYYLDPKAEYKAAFIAETYFAGGFDGLGSDKDVAAAAQYAIWQLLQKTSSFGASWTAYSATMLTDANAAVAAGYIGANWFKLTNETQQDFIAKIPEPSTLLLIGLGLVGLAGLGRRRFKG